MYSNLKERVEKSRFKTIFEKTDAECDLCKKVEQGASFLFLYCGCVVHPACIKKELLIPKKTIEEKKSAIKSLFDCIKHGSPLPKTVIRQLFSQNEISLLSQKYLKNVVSCNKGNKIK